MGLLYLSQVLTGGAQEKVTGRVEQRIVSMEGSPQKGGLGGGLGSWAIEFPTTEPSVTRLPMAQKSRPTCQSCTTSRVLLETHS